MNTRTFRGLAWLTGITGTVILVACQDLPNSAQAQNAGDIPATTNAPVAATVADTAPPATGIATTSSDAPAPAKADSDDAPPANMAPPPRTEAVLPVDLSPAVAEVAKLIQAHLSDDVILAYVHNSALPYRPTADEIVYLNDLGVSAPVLTELIERGKDPWDPATQANTAPAPEAAPVASLGDAPAPTYSVAAEQPAPPAPVPAPVAPPAVVAAQPPPVQPVTIEYFQENLAPYGSWVYVEDTGWCWRPTVVIGNPEWRPYCDRGRWVYTDCGWYWESDYSWGWATFHYGRWTHHGIYGWVWSPDTVWGPAWVCWRHHDAYCGWAPLPPRARFEVGIGLTFNHGHVGADFGFGLHEDSFTFVAYDHFRDRHPDHFRAPSHEVARIYRNSTVINNYTVINKTTIVNEGVGRERVVSMTHQPLRPVTIQHVASTGTERKMEHVDSTSRTLAVYHPHVTPTASRTATGSTAAPAVPKPVTINRPAPQRPVLTPQPAAGAPHTAIAPHANPEPHPNPVTIRPSAVGNPAPNSATPTRTAPATATSNPQSATHVTTVAPAKPATPLAPTRTTVAQPERPATPATPAPSPRATTVAPATPATPAATAVPAAPAATPTAPRPSFESHGDSTPRTTPSYTVPARTTPPPAPAPTPTRPTSSPNNVKFGNGNRNSN